jgi:hypothetical protein
MNLIYLDILLIKCLKKFWQHNAFLKKVTKVKNRLAFFAQVNYFLLRAQFTQELEIFLLEIYHFKKCNPSFQLELSLPNRLDFWPIWGSVNRAGARPSVYTASSLPAPLPCGFGPNRRPGIKTGERPLFHSRGPIYHLAPSILPGQVFPHALGNIIINFIVFIQIEFLNIQSFMVLNFGLNISSKVYDRLCLMVG